MPNDKIQSAIAIFKAQLPEAHGRFGARISEMNGNEVEITSDGAIYCVVNVRSGLIMGI